MSASPSATDVQHIVDLTTIGAMMRAGTYVGQPPLLRPTRGRAAIVWNRLWRAQRAGPYAHFIATAPRLPVVPARPASPPPRRASRRDIAARRRRESDARRGLGAVGGQGRSDGRLIGRDREDQIGEQGRMQQLPTRGMDEDEPHQQARQSSVTAPLPRSGLNDHQTRQASQDRAAPNAPPDASNAAPPPSRLIAVNRTLDRIAEETRQGYQQDPIWGSSFIRRTQPDQTRNTINVLTPEEIDARMRAAIDRDTPAGFWRNGRFLPRGSFTAAGERIVRRGTGSMVSPPGGTVENGDLVEPRRRRGQRRRRGGHAGGGRDFFEHED